MSANGLELSETARKISPKPSLHRCHRAPCSTPPHIQFAHGSYCSASPHHPFHARTPTPKGFHFTMPFTGGDFRLPKASSLCILFQQHWTGYRKISDKTLPIVLSPNGFSEILCLGKGIHIRRSFFNLLREGE